MIRGGISLKRAYTDIPEGQMHYRFSGTGSNVIIFLHMSGSSSDEFELVGEKLAQSGFYVYAPDLLGSLIASGIFIHIALQVVLNIAVVTNSIPTTGITLPFVSYGGTSIVFLMVEMGLALSVSRQIRFR